MHREAKKGDLSLENVANGWRFVSRLAATQTRLNRLFERLQLHQKSTSCTSLKNIIIPSNGSSYPFKRTSQSFERLAGAIRFETIVNFSNCSSQSIEKMQDVIRPAKNHQPLELLQAVSKNYSALCLAIKLRCVFESNKLKVNL